MTKIILVILSQIDFRYIELLSQGLEKTFCRRIEVIHRFTSLNYAYDTTRKQYKSPLLLSYLRRIKKEPDDKIMAITDMDLYSPGYDFVYGEADIHAGVATLSINRLLSDDRGISPDFSLAAERIIREAIHEIGHLFGLSHCQNQKCVMRTCTCLSEVDEARGRLCSECYKKLEPKL
ncbi:MAG: archaemetzincin family Zn-dependent metalloprotease [Dehalococcoidales bacterium]